MSIKEQDIIDIYPRIMAFAFSRTRDKHRAEDLVQTTILKALENKDQWPNVKNLSAWLITICRNKFLDNIKIIEKDLITIFDKNNIKKIDCINQKFDPNNHQAMLEIENENVEPGTVLQEIQPGYFLKDRLLRPSFVAIAKKKEVKNDEIDEKKNNSTLEEK